MSLLDLGGQYWTEDVDPEHHISPFKGPWEQRFLGVWLAAFSYGARKGNPLFSGNYLHYAIGDQIPSVFFTSTYFDRMRLALVRILLEAGYITQDELAAYSKQQNGAARQPRAAQRAIGALTPDQALSRMKKPGPKAQTPVDGTFQQGDRIRTRNIHPNYQNRFPRYLRDKVGVIFADRGQYDWVDPHCLEEGATPHRVYTIAFTAKDVFGFDKRDLIYADLSEEWFAMANASCEVGASE